MAVVDMNGDGLDDIVRLHDAEELSIELQQQDGTFTTSYTHTFDDQIWSIAIADADFNGWRDIAAGGWGNTTYLSATSQNGSLSFSPHLLSPNISLLQGSKVVVRWQAAFTVSPNPASDFLYVTHSGDKPVQYHLETLAGTQVQRKVLESGGQLPLAGVPAGVYLVRGGGQVAKVVVR